MPVGVRWAAGLAGLVVLGLVAGGYLVGRGDGIEAEKAAEVRRAAKAAQVVAKVGKGGVEISADVAGELAAA